MHRVTRTLLLLLCAWSMPGQAEPPRVVATLLPLHSLASAVMQGVATPVLLVPGNASPHDYALRPSEARALQRATLVLRVGPALETFLSRPIANLSADTRVVDLADATGVVRLPARHHDDWLSQTVGVAPTPDKDAGSADAHDAVHGPDDMHLWLSPDNAAAMLAVIEQHLASMDPENAATYAANTRLALVRLAAHERRWRERLAPVRQRPFVTFHDAYQYLEHHFGLKSIGVVAMSPEQQPSAMHLRELIGRMRATGVRCLFREPQFSTALVDMLLQSAGATAATLDPLGFGLEPGADAWYRLMDANVESLANCLSGT